MGTGRVIILIVLLLIFVVVVLPFILNIIGINIIQYGSVGGAQLGSASLIRSSDGGTTWKNAAVSESKSGFPGKILDIEFHPVHPDVMFLGAKSAGLWKSTNAGVSWAKVTDAGRVLGSTADIYRIGISHSSTTIMYLAAFQNSRGRVLKSEDAGVSFREVYFVPSDGYVVTDLYVDPVDSEHIRITTGQGGVLDSRDGGRSWRVVKWFTESLAHLMVNPDFYDEEIVETGSGKIFKTFDGGENWADLQLTGTAESSVEAPAISEQGQTIHVTPFQTTSRLASFSHPSIEALVADPSNFERMYIAATDGLYRSTDGAFTWKQLEVLIPKDALPVSAVAVHPGNPQILFAGARNQLHWSSDSGTHWSVQTLPTSSRVLNLLFHPLKPEVVFGVLGR